jgi:hypothetical protein
MTLDNLKMLLALNGKQRIHYMEPEIFASKRLYKRYLNNICSAYDFYNEYTDVSPGTLIYYYSWDIIKGRWPEAEKVIANDSNWAYYYAMYILKARWPEAECSISKNRTIAKLYNNDFGTNI